MGSLIVDELLVALCVGIPPEAEDNRKWRNPGFGDVVNLEHLGPSVLDGLVPGVVWDEGFKCLLKFTSIRWLGAFNTRVNNEIGQIDKFPYKVLACR